MLRTSRGQGHSWPLELMIVGLLVPIYLIALTAGAALADAQSLPTYDGALQFSSIESSSDPEEFSWEVTVGEGELVQINDQSAVVFYPGREHAAFSIMVAPAHDAVGTNVPTSLSVSDGNVVTLTVHHRAGNPAAGGAPFDYPIIEGVGWEGGFRTEAIGGLKDEQQLREERERREKEEGDLALRQGSSRRCLVPRLDGRSLKESGRRLMRAACEIGSVKTLMGVNRKTGKVVKQSPRPGAVLPSGAAIRLTLGE